MHRASRLAIALSLFSMFGTLQMSATGPDAAWGKYSYQGKDLNFEVLWTDAKFQASINGKSFPNAFSSEIENKANFSYTQSATYPFRFTFEESKSGAKYLDLILLFDRGHLVLVSGLYWELEKLPSGEFRVTKSRAIPVTFSRVS